MKDFLKSLCLLYYFSILETAFFSSFDLEFYNLFLFIRSIRKSRITFYFYMGDFNNSKYVILIPN